MTLRKVLRAGGLLIVAAALANAESITGFLSGSVSPSGAYTLTLNGFNNMGGTLVLDSVTLYFSASETLNTLTVTSKEPVNTAQFGGNSQTNFVRNFSNSASATDTFTGETLQIYDSGGGTAVGNCTANPATTVPPANGCTPFTLGPGASATFGPYTVSNTNSIYGLPTGTGALGLLGVVRTDSTANAQKYLATALAGGTFTLNGTILTNSGSTEIGSGANNSSAVQSTSVTVQAEVDYSYHALPTLSCPATVSGTVGVAFNSAAPTVSGGVGPFTFAINSGTLPTGLTLNTTTGAITGTPTSTGSFTLKVTDSLNEVATSCTYTINPAPTVTCPSTALSTGTVGAAFNSPAVTVTGGTAPFTFAVATGALPTGLTLNTSTGAVTGTPTATGSFTLKATDASGISTSTCPFTINAAPTVTCPSTAASTGTLGAAFNSPAITASGGTGTLTFSVATGTLPMGLTLNTSTGAVTGTPAASGTFTLKVTDANGASSSTCPFTINAAPTVTCPSTAASTGTVGAAFNSPAITVTGGTAPFVFAVATGTLPTGLTLNTSTGAVTGTPTAAGTFTLKVTDANLVSSSTCPFTVNAAPTVTCPSTALSTGTVGAAFNSPAISVTGGTAPFTFAVATGALPTGLTLNTSTGAVTGTPTATGTFTLKATDASGVSTSTCPFTINAAPTVTCPSTAASTGTAGAAFNSPAITVTGGTAPFTFAVATGALPTGLTLNTSTGAITGTPTASGSFTLKATDASGASTSTCPFTINAAPTVTCPSTALSTGTVGAAFNSPAISVTGGTAPFTFALASGALPTGLTLNTSTGAVTGTPTAAGSFTLKVTDANSVASATCPFTINAAPSVTCPAAGLSTGTVGAAFNSGTITVTGGTAPFTFALATGALPAGLTLNTSTGAVTGTPTATGSFTLKVTDTNGVFSAACPFTINAAAAPPPPLSLTCPSTALSTGTVGAAFNSGAVTVAGGIAPFTFSVASGTLPGGLTLNTSTGAITGTPTAAGSFTLKVTDSVGAIGTTCPFTVNAAPTVACPSTALSTGTAGAAFNSGALAVTGGTAPFKFSVASGTLPAGLTLNTSTGAVTGTPTAAGSFTLKVTDTNGISGTSCPFTINAAPTVTCPSTGLSTGTVGAPFSSGAITVAGGTAPLTFFVASGTLPAGLTLNASTGAITGTPTAAGSFTLKVTDASGASSTTCPFTINAAPQLSVTCPANTAAMVGVAYSSTLTGAGGVPPYMFSIFSGSLGPLSLNASTGAITGTPSSAGTITFTAKITDSSTPTHLTATTAATCTIVVSPPPPTLTCPAITTGTVGVAYSSTLTGAGGMPPYMFSIFSGSLGPLTLNSSTGAIAGTPSTAGTITFTVQITDSTSPTHLTATSGTCTIVVSPPPPTVTCPSITTGTVGAAYSSTLTGAGGVPPYMFSIISGSLAPLTLNASTGAITGTLPSAGTVTFTAQISDSTSPTHLTATTSAACTIVFSGTAPNLSLTKTSTGTFLAGGPGVFTMVVTNNGSGPTSGVVTLSDPPLPFLTPTAVSGTGWTCVLATVTCTRSDVLAPGASYPPVTLNVNIAANAPANFTNVASTTGGGAPPSVSASASASVSLTVVISTFTLSKTADRPEAQTGDVVGYTLQATNSTNTPFTNAQVQDTPPPGFQYVAGSGRLTVGAAASQPITPVNSGGVLTFALGTVAPQQTDVITYRLQIGAKTRPGRNVNVAQATGSGGASSPAQAVVLVESSLFTDRQFLIGKVFVDSNGNGLFDEGERPVAGVRIYLSNGGSATTDSQGLYNIPTIAPGSVVVSLDPATLPKGYTISSGGRLDFESWSRLVRTPLEEGMILRQNFALKPCPYCAPAPAPLARPGAAPVAVSGRPAAKLEIFPSQESLPGDGRTSMTVRVRVLDDQGNPAQAKEVRIRTSAGQFVKEDDTNTSALTAPASTTPASTAVAAGGSALSGKNTEPQRGLAIEQVPQTMQAGMARAVAGEATFLLMAANTPGVAHLVAESGDPDHLLSTTTDIWFTPEKRSPILVTDGEITVGRAAPEVPIFGQGGEVTRRADIFLRTPLTDGYLMTLGYTSHLNINDSNGNPGLFQMDPLNRVYQVYGDSSTQYQAAQSNAHAYGRIEHDQSYVMFGDLRMSSAPVNGAPTPASQAFSPQPGAPDQITYGVGDYSRNVVGAAIHLEDSHHDFITLEGARPNTGFARDVFPGSTFGLIQLSHINILPGSESGLLETRDVHNPEIVLASEQLVRSVDYTIDPYTGAVFFLRTLNAYDQALNLNQVVFTYEYQSTTGVSSVYGIRTQLRISSWGLKLGLGVTDQRDPVAGSYFLGDVTLQQDLPNKGRLSIEVPVSHGTALSAGFTNGTSTNVNGVAIRGDIDQPFPWLSGRFRGSFSKTDADFFNPFGTTVIPGAQTSRGTVEVSPIRKLRLKLGFTDERNHTILVDNQRQTASLEAKQSLGETLIFTAGYDFRDFQDALTTTEIQSNEVSAGLEWKPFKKFTASARREQNLTASDPTYPNETLLGAHYQASETVRLFATERLGSAPIIPIGDLSTTGFSSLAGKNETAIGIDDKWSKYTTIESKYLVENGINGTDSYAVIGLVNRLPVQEHLTLDLGLERGELVKGPDRSFNSGSIGFSWLPKKNFRASTRYEIRDLGGLGQIITTGVAGKLADGLTALARFQYSDAAFQPGTGAVDVLNPMATNSILSQQTHALQGTAALAWRPWKTDREGILFSYTLRDATLDNVDTTTQPQHDSVALLSTDGFYQANRWLEFYGKFAFSDRTYNYVGAEPISNVTYLWQARAQARISRRFDAALEGRTVYQPDTSTNQWTVGAEVGFWVVKDLRAGLGYSFKSADLIAADFLTSPVKQGVYFTLTSKLSNMFNLFKTNECGCTVTPAPHVEPPQPVANIEISAITGGRDVCPGDNLQLRVTASGWLPDQTPVYQWYIGDQPVAGATGTSLAVPTANGSGSKSIKVSVTAGGITKMSDPVTVLVKPTPPPTIRFVVSPSVIGYGDKLPLAATSTASECTAPAPIVYTASEGTITGATFDSTGVTFDPDRTKPQSKVVHLTATATDRIGQTASSTGDVTITLTPQARRLDDLVFAKDSDRVNNCGKRLLLEELTPMLRADPGAKVILIGHRDTGEKSATIDRQRVLNAAAVLSAGKGICPQLDLSRLLVKWAGTDQSSDTRPALCGSSTQERSGQAVSASDARAQFRRVEIWFIPSGAGTPAAITGLTAAPERDITAKGCPR